MTKGERIKFLRERIGLSQVMLANKINVSKQTMYKYENDIITNIPSDKIEAIAEVTHSSPWYIMGWDNEITPLSKEDGYYVYGDTAEFAQELFENPDMRVLFDAARGSKSQDLKLVANMLRRLKETNPDG